MEKLKKIFAVVVLVCFTVLCACSSKASDMAVEEHIVELAETSVVPETYYSNFKGSLRLEKKENGSRIELVNKFNGSTLYFIDNVAKFYNDEDPYKDIEFQSSGEIAKKHLKKFEKAKELALIYLSSSKIITEEDKERIREIIEEKVVIHYGEIKKGVNSDSDIATVMLTKGSEIYVNEKCEKMISIHTFLHELIHIISNETNSNSKYENSFYRFSKINEALTDLITQQILIDSGLENQINKSVRYILYFNHVFLLMEKVDMLDAYFYSDNFDIIFQKLNKDWLNVYYMVIEWGSDYEVFKTDLPLSIAAQL